MKQNLSSPRTESTIFYDQIKSSQQMKIFSLLFGAFSPLRPLAGTDVATHLSEGYFLLFIILLDQLSYPAVIASCQGCDLCSVLCLYLSYAWSARPGPGPRPTTLLINHICYK